MYRSVWDLMHYGMDPLCLDGTVMKLERYDSISDHLHNWTHLVPDSRSDPYRIHQVPYKHKAYSCQSRTGSKRMRSRVNAALVILPFVTTQPLKCNDRLINLFHSRCLAFHANEKIILLKLSD